MHSRAGDPDMSELAPIVAAPASLRREPDRRRRGRRIFLPPRGRTLAAGAWNRPLRIPATGGEESERRVPHAIALPGGGGIRRPGAIAIALPAGGGKALPPFCAMPYNNRMPRRPAAKPARDIRLEHRDRARKRDIDRIEQGLIDHNEAVAPHDMPYRDFTVLAKDAKGRILGGLYGKMYWDWLFIEKMWVDNKARRKGLGLRIMAAGEARAREFGCHSAWLDTMSFQARPFYEKQGYRLFGQLDDFPIGQKRYFMAKRLASLADAQRKAAAHRPQPKPVASRAKRKGARSGTIQAKSAPTASATRAKPSPAKSSASSRSRRRTKPGPS